MYHHASASDVGMFSVHKGIIRPSMAFTLPCHRYPYDVQQRSYAAHQAPVI